MLLWSALLWAASAGAVECTEPVTQEQLVTTMDAAEQALMDLEDTVFRDRVNEAAGLLLPCVGQALPPEVVARYHRLMALHLMAIGDEDKARGAVIAARTLAPDTGYPPELVPDSHPLAAIWNEAIPDPATRTVPEPKYGSLGFDGEIGRARPRNRPTLAQVFDESGLAVSTQYLGAREPLPTYTAIPRQRNMLIACSGVALAGAGATYGLGWGARATLYDNAANPNTKANVLLGNRSTANLLSVLSGAAVGVSLGCGAGAVAIGQR